MGAFARREVVLMSGRAVVLRAAEEADGGAFLEFHRHTSATSPFVATSPDELTETAADRAKAVRQHRERPNELLLLAIDESLSRRPDETMGGIVGGLGLRTPGKRKLNHVVDLGMSVRDTWRGQGLGRVLMAAALDWATQNPMIEKVCLGVMPPNDAAMKLYVSMGFEVEGVQRRYVKQAVAWGGGYLDHVLMAKWVKPV